MHNVRFTEYRPIPSTYMYIIYGENVLFVFFLLFFCKLILCVNKNKSVNQLINYTAYDLVYFMAVVRFNGNVATFNGVWYLIVLRSVGRSEFNNVKTQTHTKHIVSASRDGTEHFNKNSN